MITAPVTGQTNAQSGLNALTDQSLFATALLDPELPPPPGLRTCNGSDPARRFAVYRNNVLHTLTDALADTFPVTQALVGEAFFRAMAQVYVRRQPPRSPILAFYGVGFPDFVESFAPAQSVPYLADVARLEMARVQAFHATDVATITRERLTQVMAQAEGVGERIVVLDPSVQVLRSPHPMVSVWAAHQQEEVDLSGVDWSSGEAALVCRQVMDVLILPVAPATAAFVAGLQQRQPLTLAAGSAAAQLLPGETEFDLSRALALLLQHGCISEMN